MTPPVEILPEKRAELDVLLSGRYGVGEVPRELAKLKSLGELQYLTQKLEVDITARPGAYLNPVEVAFVEQIPDRLQGLEERTEQGLRQKTEIVDRFGRLIGRIEDGSRRLELERKWTDLRGRLITLQQEVQNMPLTANAPTGAPANQPQSGWDRFTENFKSWREWPGMKQIREWWYKSPELKQGQPGESGEAKPRWWEFWNTDAWKNTVDGTQKFTERMRDGFLKWFTGLSPEGKVLAVGGTGVAAFFLRHRILSAATWPFRQAFWGITWPVRALWNATFGKLIKGAKSVKNLEFIPAWIRGPLIAAGVAGAVGVGAKAMGAEWSTDSKTQVEIPNTGVKVPLNFGRMAYQIGHSFHGLDYFKIRQAESTTERISISYEDINPPAQFMFIKASTSDPAASYHLKYGNDMVKVLARGQPVQSISWGGKYLVLTYFDPATSAQKQEKIAPWDLKAFLDPLARNTVKLNQAGLGIRENGISLAALPVQPNPSGPAPAASPPPPTS